MTIRLETDVIVMEGNCGVDDVEPLLVLLDARPDTSLDLSRAETLHTAIWQLMLMRRPHVRGNPRSGFARDHMLPAIAASEAGI